LPERDHTLYLQDMLGFCARVLEYTAGLHQQAFLADKLRYDAALRNLELNGVAAQQVPDSIRV
jgi:uncharacterized protein with HEPN domain